MIKKIKRNCRVYLRKEQVLIRVRWSNATKTRLEVAFSVGVCANESKWDSSSGRAKLNTTHTIGRKTFTAKQINYCISRFLDGIDTVFKTWETKGAIPTKEDLKSSVDEILERKKDKDEDRQKEQEAVKDNSLDHVFEEFLKLASIENTWGKNTHLKYVHCVNHLKCCVGNKITLDIIDKKMLTKLKEWYIQNGYSDQTTIKQFRNFRGILKWAKNNGYIVNEQAFVYELKLSSHKKVVTHLTRKELDQFAKFKFPENKKYLTLARDGFMFMSYTSLRYSDLAALRTSNIRNNFEYIEIYTQKTQDLLNIPLIPYAKDILLKYVNLESSEDKLVFPVYSNNRMNDHLKEAARLAGLDRIIQETRYIGGRRVDKSNRLYETITCHDARRTFVCNSLSYGIPPSVVSKCTGHATLNSMAPYIATADVTVAREMKKWVSAPLIEEIDSLISNMTEDKLLQILEFIRNVS